MYKVEGWSYSGRHIGKSFESINDALDYASDVCMEYRIILRNTVLRHFIAPAFSQGY